MKIIYKKFFEKQLSDIIDYIAKDKIRASYEFAKKLEESILNIPNAPYKYRKSIYFKDKILEI